MDSLINARCFPIRKKVVFLLGEAVSEPLYGESEFAAPGELTACLGMHFAFLRVSLQVKLSIRNMASFRFLLLESSITLKHLMTLP
ncbi:hypothetical protein NC99_05440 [Sunxiuqinia dokdonensis]|uniref:Uncharacterized protein n=1 Tax=Sunxiuqinia dokdonensis TaxID=1409788 RepID=A0A0L8VEG2_9BACT|nr:hypothetical protein NC99_05440 [Sunxiuqinia dokdonensis]